MLTDQQLKEKIQRRELEVNFRNKGINLDSELQKELNHWWGILDKVLDRKIHYKKKSSDLEMKVDEGGAKIIQLMASKQGLDQKIINHKARDQKLNKKITDLESEIDDLNQLNKSLTNDYTTLEAEYQELEAQYNLLKGNHGSLQGDYDTLLVSVKYLDNLINELENQLNDTLNDYEALGNKHQKLNSTLKKIKAEKAKLNHWIRTILVRQKKELIEKLNKEKVIANSYREEKNEIIQQGQQDRTNFLNTLRHKQNNIQELENYLNNADELLDKKNQEIVHLLTEKARLTNQGKQKQKQIILLTQQLGTDQEKNRELIKLITRLEKKLEKQGNKRQRLIFTKELHRQRIII